MARIFLLLLFCIAFSYAQTISTTTPVPPLQWINLTPLQQGNVLPPPLKDPAIGYDEISRTLILFGGESEGGFAQAQTYLLNLDTLTWSVPSPPQDLRQSPPARSAALAGQDFAASNRHAFVVIGGKGSDSNALSDVWAFDFNNHFWSQVNISPGGPSPRWGATGGIDIRVDPISDPVVPGPNNTFYLAGGSNGDRVYPLSDIWSLHLSGTLSSNLPNSVTGSWERLSVGDFPGLAGQGSAVIGQQLIAAGGCESTPISNQCALQNTFVFNIGRQSGISPSGCPVPRLGPALAPNLNSFSSSFNSQLFMLLGTYDRTRWNDDNGLERGEIAILDINAGAWSRILPSGDPGTSGTETFPVPREGAAVISFENGLVGPSRRSSADTIIFGGRDASGNYLSDVWLLRSYTGLITPSTPRWSGFGNGRLQTGVGAEGRGVEVEYLTSCATPITAISSTTSTRTSSGIATPSSSVDPFPTGTQSIGHSYKVSLSHKVLSAVSLMILQVVLLVFRNQFRLSVEYVAAAVAVGAYGIGIAGFILAFTTLSMDLDLVLENLPSHLNTGHGIAGLVFFICLYVLVPIWLLTNASMRRIQGTGGRSTRNSRGPDEQMGEKLEQLPGHNFSGHSIHNGSPPSSPRPRTQSWGPSSFQRRSLDAGFSSDSESVMSGGQRGFEVVNRLHRPRQPSVGTGTVESPLTAASRNLGEIDWLLRRRSLNLVGELDYALTQGHNNARISTPGTADILLAPNDPPKLPPAEFPPPSDILLHLFTHTSILALSVFILISLWDLTSRVFFILFFIWTIVFYITLLSCAWFFRPPVSILSAAVYKFRGTPSLNPSSDLSFTSPPPQTPSTTRQIYHSSSPYIHQPPYRATTTDEYANSNVSPRSIEPDEDDIDEVTRQRMIEEEMDRRDVSIVTVPKRRLLVVNPS